MKKISILALAAASLASTALAAPTANKGPGSIYVGIEGGYQMTPGKMQATQYTAKAVLPQAKTEYTAGTEDAIKLKGYSKGALISPKLGYVMTDNLRADVAFTYNFDNTIKNEEYEKPLTSSSELKVEVKSWDVLATFYYDFLNQSELTPFVGVSAGYGSRTVNPSFGKLTTPVSTASAGIAKVGEIEKDSFVKNTSKGFVFGGTVGVSYKISDEVQLQLAYAIKRLNIGESKVEKETKEAHASAVNSLVFKLPRLQHSFNAGVRFMF